MENVGITPKLEANLRKLRVLTKFKANALPLLKTRGSKYQIMTLEGAFNWDDSNEGVEFWINISLSLRNLNKGEKQ